MAIQRLFKSTFSTYRRGEQIGEGGCGRVFAAKDDDGQRVAVKVLDASKATPARVKRFKNEVTFCSRSTHPNVVRVIDHGLVYQGDDAVPFFVMPMYEGSLRKLMKAELPQHEVLPIFAMVLDGVDSAHRQAVVHRDLKPENILFRRHSPDGIEIVVADFGISEFTDEELFTAVETNAQERLANFQYAAPEQRRRGGKVDHRADIFALGLILNELFTGEVPNGTDYKAVGEVSAQFAFLDPVIDTMLRQDPQGRFSSVDDVKREIGVRHDTVSSERRLRQLRAIEISSSDVTDPILADPIQIVDANWHDGELTLTFQHEINDHWLQAFRNMGSHTSVMGAGPERWYFDGNRASVTIRPDSAQSAVDYFKDWLPNIHRVYENRLARIAEQEEARKRKEVEDGIRREELNARMRSELRF